VPLRRHLVIENSVGLPVTRILNQADSVAVEDGRDRAALDEFLTKPRFDTVTRWIRV
jgi:hypothetical protein